MKSIIVILSILISNQSISQTLPGSVAFTPEEIVGEKVNKVNEQNQLGETPEVDISIFKSAESSNGINYASVAKTQQVGLDLNTEAEALRNNVISEQVSAGAIDPKGCADVGALTEYQNNVCTAAFTLQSMAIEAIDEQATFKDVAEKSYETMEDVSAFPLDGSGAHSFSSDSSGLPTPSSILYPSSKAAIDSFHQLYKSLDETSEYKGLKYSTKTDTFYLEGKKYSSSVLSSKDAMIKAGISKSLANFAYTMLGKKSVTAQSKVMSLLKAKNLYDGKNWNIIKYSKLAQESGPLAATKQAPDIQEKQYPSPSRASGVINLSSSLVEEKTLYRSVNGIQLGLSSDDIFKIISRKYREKDRLGFFHTPPKK